MTRFVTRDRVQVPSNEVTIPGEATGRPDEDVSRRNDHVGLAAGAGDEARTRTPDAQSRQPEASVIAQRLHLFPLVEPNPGLIAIYGRFAQGAGLTVAALAILVLLGWALDLTVLKSLSPDLVSMKVNTAVALGLAGAALFLLSRPASPEAMAPGYACAFLVLLTGLLTLAEYAFGWRLGIDQLLISEAPGARLTAEPGRMAPAAALDLVLVGAALLALDIRRCYPIAQLHTALAAVIALTALIGYVYGVPSLYHLGSTTAMALHTSLCFLALAAGILLARQDHGFLVILSSDAAGGVMARRLIPAAILTPLALGWLSVLGERTGIHGPEFAVFLLVISSLLCFTALIWWNTGSLHRLDLKRRQAEEDLRRGRLQLEQAQRIAQVGSGEWEKGANRMTWSDELYRMLGRRQGDFEPTFETLFQDVHPEDKAAVTESMNASALHGAPAAADFRLVAPDGALRFMHTESRPHLDEAGAVTRVSWTTQDITERKRIEQALRQSESRTRSVIDSANDAYVAIDPNSKITDWNPQAEAMFGWSRDEALGRSLLDLIVPPEFRRAHREGIHRFIRTGEGAVLDRRLEITALHRDGHLFPIELTVSAIRWGRSYTFSAFIRDITELKKTERALARQRDELSRINAELEDFTHSVSHDLKEPLRGIEAFAGFLAEDYGDTLDEQGQRYVSVLRESAVRMKDLIDDLLQLSRIGRAPIEYGQVPVASLVEDVRLELSYALQEKGAQLRVDRGLPSIPCDRVRLREVFKNLISNAIKYNDKTVPVIEVRGHAENGAHVISVADNGIGIPPEFHDKVFRIFQRLHHRDEYEGTGVGLAICKKVIESHGGRIWIESQPGEGTTFLFTIPADHADIPREITNGQNDGPP